jgi:hypothetical protein
VVPGLYQVQCTGTIQGGYDPIELVRGEA